MQKSSETQNDLDDEEHQENLRIKGMKVKAKQ